MAKVISVFSQKGGVGKTTVSVNLSAALALMLSHENSGTPGRVLLVDLDEQAHGALALSSGFYGNSKDADLGPYDNIAGLLTLKTTAPVTSIIRQARIPIYAEGNLDYIPSSRSKMAMVGVSLMNAGREGLLRLIRIIEPIEHMYEYVVIDNPPGLNYLALNGLITANYVMVLTQLEAPSIESLRNSMQTVRTVQEDYNPNLELLGIVPNMCDFRITEQAKFFAVLNEYYEGQILPHISRRSEISYAMSEGLDIFSYRPPRSKTELVSASTSVKQFAKLANRIRKRMRAAEEQQKEVV